MRAQCPECDKVYQLNDALAGKTVRCKECGGTFTVRSQQRPRSEDEFEVVEDEDDFEEPVVRPGRGTRSQSGIKIKGSKSGRKHDTNSVNAWPWIFGGLGVLVVAVVLICGGIFFVAKNAMRDIVEGNEQQRQERERVVAAVALLEVPDAGPISAPYPIDRYPLPVFPELGPGELIPGTDVLVETLTLAPPPGKEHQPGFAMQMRVYRPAGEHSDKSLPLVLVAPAGTPLFVGNGLDDPEYHAETLPYAQAGAVVVMFSLDGAVVDLDAANNSELSIAYEKFRRAAAGMVNARTALEFSLEKIQSVDPARIVIAGHSSAGTLAMLYATHEPRLSAAIGYCACTDVQTRMAEAVPQLRGPLFPEIESFFVKSSPRTHAASTKCPVFLFHAADDSNVPFLESDQYLELLQSNGKDAVLSQPPAFGDHYQPMIDEGIPRAIKWLQGRGILAGE